MSNPIADQQLSAWAEWKQVCSILGCSPGHRDILSARVRRFIQKQAQREKVGDDLASRVVLNDFLQQLDGYIIERLTDTDERGRKRKALKFKEVVWGKIANNPSDALKIINGCLFGLKGLARMVLMRYYRTVLRNGNRTSSLDAVIGEDRETTLGDLIGYCDPEQLMPSAESNQEFCRSLLLTLTVSEKVVLLAFSCRISLDHPEVSAAAGMKKSVIYNTRDQALKKLTSLEWFDTAAILIDMIAEDLKTEKNTENFLMLVQQSRSSY